MASCPHCIDVILAREAGAWLEDVCGACDGRFLDGDTLQRLSATYLRVDPDMLRELCLHGPRRLRCPGCGQRMSLTMLRGVQVDLCGGCGGAWLDKGELLTLTRGDVREVGASVVVAGATLVDEARAMFGVPAPPVAAPAPAPVSLPRFVVLCTNCSGALDLATTNYLINNRPWCARCAAPYAGFGGIVADVAGGVLATLAGLITRNSLLGLLTPDDDGGSAGSVDVLRIAPADAEVRFGPFFKPA